MSPSMAEVALPRRLDAIRSVDHETILSGSLDVDLFKRFQEAVEDVNGPVDYKLAFQRDVENHMFIDGECSTRATMVCQRCLDAVVVVVQGKFQIGLAFSDEKAKHLPKHYEPAIMDHNGNIDPWELVEDELILALPMFAYHADGECEIKQPKAETEQVEVTEKDDNPFAVLQQLKSK
ncbi:MAG: DUF177 domain-containing protein [Oleispira sp.]|nr:DUF177 domain-containing protein [Oleispira sp.]